MSIRFFLPIDGDTSSKAINEALEKFGLSAAALDVTRPLISQAVIDAQIGQGLSQFAGIAQVPMEAAPQSVANVASTSAGVALS